MNYLKHFRKALIFPFNFYSDTLLNCLASYPIKGAEKSRTYVDSKEK